jgi:hypothetical protein
MKILVSACLLQYKYTKKIVKRSSIIHIFLLMKDQYDIPKRYLLLFKRVSISSSDNFCLKLNTLSTAVPKSLAKGLSNEISGYVLFVSHFYTEEVVIPRAFATCSCVRPFIFLSF